MDLTAAQAKVDTLTAQVANDQATLTADQQALAEAQAELKQGTLINDIEALASAPDQLEAVVAALQADGYTVTITPPVAS